MMLSPSKMINWKIAANIPYICTNMLFYNIYFWTIMLALCSTIVFFSLKNYTIHSTRSRKLSVLSSLPDENFLGVRNDDVVLTDWAYSEKLTEERSSYEEALAAFASAETMFERGRNLKASKLVRHAYSLAPEHPDVLNMYGMYLVRYGDSLLTADDAFAKALSVSPRHRGALANRRKLAPLVEKIDTAMLITIDEKRDRLADTPATDMALIRAKKEAYYLNIYHTVGLEGNTMTLHEARYVVETKMAVEGHSVNEHNEILGLDAAMKFINTTLIHKMGQMTLSDVLNLHKYVMGSVDPHNSGKLRMTRVFISGHVPPGPAALPEKMDLFVKWLNSKAALDLHPVKYAAIAHYKLVHIHPFVDGNGRTSRLLMNIILMQAGFPPVIVSKAYRKEYYMTLKEANHGNLRPFIRFIARCTERTLDFYIAMTRNPAIEHKETVLKIVDADSVTVPDEEYSNAVVLPGENQSEDESERSKILQISDRDSKNEVAVSTEESLCSATNKQSVRSEQSNNDRNIEVFTDL